MTTRRCPNCDREMEHVEADPDVGIIGHWFCSLCDKTFDDDDDYDESDL